MALNIGGIANVTVIPAGARQEDVFAFDTGPGNMIVDALAAHATRGRRKYDRDARIAMRGKTIPALLDLLMRDAYLRKPPPKTAGREQFGRAYSEKILAWGRKRRRANGRYGAHRDGIYGALDRRRVSPVYFSARARGGMIVGGGGARNPLLMAQLAAALQGVRITQADEYGVGAEAKEAFAFAVLAYEAYHGRTNNLPHATGAKKRVVMGKMVRGG